MVVFHVGLVGIKHEIAIPTEEDPVQLATYCYKIVLLYTPNLKTTTS